MQNQEKNLFNDQQWEEVVSLLEALSVSQAEWLSQYLDDFYSHAEKNSQNTEGRCVVAYGSETGNSRAVAEGLVETGLKHGKNIDLLNLSDAKLRHLSSVSQLFVICSTHGDGDPPEPIESFYQALLASENKLEHISYAVLALGDSTYEKFCECGKQIDEKLSQLSALRLIERVDCDVDYQEQADSWIEQVLSFIHVNSETSLASVQTNNSQRRNEVTKTNPTQVEVLENLCLTDKSRRNRIHHIELGGSDLNLSVSPGDSIGVLPHNPPSLVERILSQLNLAGDESVLVKDTAMPLVQALREHYDLRAVSSKFLKKWAEITNSGELVGITSSEPAATRNFLKLNQLTDIISKYPGEIEAQSLIKILRPLQPRLYDVANSLKHTSGELHLCVERYLYKVLGREISGIASNYLIGLGESESVSIFPQPNKRFRLPANASVPLILIADGTGIAPYRAFIQEFEVDTNRKHPVWLVLRERQFLEDFLYQMEWQKALDEGHLTRLDTVFWGDDPLRTLFDVFADNYELFKGWLEAGAHVYLSGHRHQIEEFESLLGSGLDSDPSVSGVWQRISSQGRVHRNLY